MDLRDELEAVKKLRGQIGKVTDILAEIRRDGEELREDTFYTQKVNSAMKKIDAADNTLWSAWSTFGDLKEEILDELHRPEADEDTPELFEE